MALARSMTDRHGYGTSMVWASPTTFLVSRVGRRGHSNRDGLRSGQVRSPVLWIVHLSCPRPMIHSHSTPLHSTPTRQAPRERYYIICSGSARHPPGAAYPMVLSPGRGISRHHLFGHRWWHWHRVAGIGKDFHSSSTRRRGMVRSSAFAGACHCKPIERLRVNL